MRFYKRLGIQISTLSVVALFISITFSGWLYLRDSLIIVDIIDPKIPVALPLIKPQFTTLSETGNKLALINQFKDIVAALPSELAQFDYLIFNDKFNILVDSTDQQTFIELVRAETKPNKYVVMTSSVFDKADILYTNLMIPAITLKTRFSDKLKLLAIPKVEPRKKPNINAIIANRITDHLFHFWWLYVVLSSITILTIHIRLRPLRKLEFAALQLSKNKIPQQICGAGYDEIGRLVTAFNTASEKLKLFEQERARLFSDISHELRTPVTNMLGRIEAYDDGIIKDPDAVIQFTGEQLSGLANIIEDIQLLNNAESKQLKITPQITNLGDLLKIWLNRSQFNNTFKSQLYCDEVNLMVDPLRFNQVLDNLLNNALTAKSEGLCIRIRVIKSKMNIEIMFEDNGQGVASDHLPLLFDRLYRVDTSRADTTGGIVKVFIEAHSGNVSAYQATTGGLGISIKLPSLEG